MRSFCDARCLKLVAAVTRNFRTGVVLKLESPTAEALRMPRRRPIST